MRRFSSPQNIRRFVFSAIGLIVGGCFPIAPPSTPASIAIPPLTETVTDTALPTSAAIPSVTPAAGGRIIFLSSRDGNAEIYGMDPDGSNVVNLTNHPGYDGEPSRAP